MVVLSDKYAETRAMILFKFQVQKSDRHSKFLITYGLIIITFICDIDKIMFHKKQHMEISYNSLTAFLTAYPPLVGMGGS